MKRTILPLLMALVATLIYCFAVYAQQDITPPQIVSAYVEPAHVDTSLGPATLYVTIHVVDDLSGTVRAYYRFMPKELVATPGQFVDAYTDKSDAECSGTPNDLTCRIPIEIPQFAAFGEWVPTWVFTKDKVGNRGDFEHQLTAYQLATFFNGPTVFTDHVYLPLVTRPDVAPAQPETGYEFNKAIVQRCDPNEGVTYVQGTTYKGGNPVNGYIVAFSYAPDGPVVAEVQSGPHPGYPGWNTGYYSHILGSNGPREGNWYFWIKDSIGNRISQIANLHTDGSAGGDKCQQATIDFDS